MWRHGKELGKGEGIYSMRPSETQCDGDIKMQSIGNQDSLGLWLVDQRVGVFYHF